MIKKSVLLLLAAALLCAVLTPLSMNIYAAATSGECGENLTWSYDKATKTLTISGTGEMGDCQWRDSPWYSFVNEIETIILPNGITSIGTYAFAICPQLKNVEIPNTVTHIGAGAFYWCGSLTSITIPNSVTSIGNAAFSTCTSLTSVTLPDSVTTVSNSLFDSCLALENVTLGKNVTSIGASAFSNCYALTEIVLPNSVTNIDYCAFYRCTALKSIVIPNSVTNIGYSAFSGCTALTSATIPNTVKTIGDRAFEQCSSLKSIVIPNSVSEIGQFVFSKSGVTSLEISKDLTNIQPNSFADCPDLMSIHVDEKNPAFCTDANGVLFNKDMSVLYSYPGGRPGTYVIPNSVIRLETGAFDGSIHLTDVTIPSSVKEIGDAAFYGCSSLKSIALPSGLTCINASAFSDCSGLTDVVLPNTVKVINDAAFSGCSSLRNINIPDGVTELKEGAFYECGSLTDIVLPNTVKTVGPHLFCYCRNLKRVNLPDGITKIEEGVFFECNSLTSIVIPESVTEISDYAFYGCTSMKSVYFKGNAPTAIGKDALPYGRDEITGEPLYLKDLVFYFVEGKSGWTSPNWNGYATEIWEPDSDFPKDFDDVSTTDWFYDAVNFAVSNNLFNGMGDNKFEPDTEMNRAMLVTVLWRYAGSPKEGTNTFTDVKSGAWYADAVSWASSKGIVNGVAAGKFDPNGNVTREQLAAILYRFCNSTGIATDKRGDLSSFPDHAEVSSWAKDAFAWAVGKGLISGNVINGKTMLDPQGNATRAQVATILMRFINQVVSK